MLKKKNTSLIISYVILIVLAFIMIYPLLWMVGASFKSNDEIFSTVGLLPKHPVFGAFAAGSGALPRRRFFSRLAASASASSFARSSASFRRVSARAASTSALTFWKAANRARSAAMQGISGFARAFTRAGVDAKASARQADIVVTSSGGPAAA